MRSLPIGLYTLPDIRRMATPAEQVIAAAMLLEHCIYLLNPDQSDLQKKGRGFASMIKSNRHRFTRMPRVLDAIEVYNGIKHPREARSISEEKAQAAAHDLIDAVEELAAQLATSFQDSIHHDPRSGQRRRATTLMGLGTLAIACTIGGLAWRHGRVRAELRSDVDTRLISLAKSAETQASAMPRSPPGLAWSELAELTRLLRESLDAGTSPREVLARTMVLEEGAAELEARIGGTEHAQAFDGLLRAYVDEVSRDAPQAVIERLFATD